MILSTTQLAILIVVALVGGKLIDLATSYFFKKITRDDYVTKKDCEVCHLNVQTYISKTDCEKCSAGGDSEVKKLSGEISLMRGILLVIAVKAGIPAEELKGLTQ